RFWTRVMRDIKGERKSDPNAGLVSFSEPFTRLLCQGMVLNHIYSRRTEKGGIEYLWPDDVEWVTDDDGKPVSVRSKIDGKPVDYGGLGTMSKSKNNGVDPQELIDLHGADTARLFVMFASPPEQTLEWSSTGVEGALRFLRRLWHFAAAHAATVAAAPAEVDAAGLATGQRELRREVHSILKQADYDYQRTQYNTVVSAAMKMLNALEGASYDDTPASAAVLRECLSILLRILYPIVPHITHAIWVELGYADSDGDLLDAAWPEVAAEALTLDEI